MAIVVSIIAMVLITITCNSQQCHGVSVEKDITLSQQEKMALDEFRAMMDNYLYADFMRKDIYLIKFLRARNLDLQAAKQMLLKNIEWRRENKMDTIVNEDFSKYDIEFPISIESIDYEGRPVITFDVAQWDVRRAILSGQRDIVTRHVYRQVEMAVRKVRDAQKRGLLVTQLDVLADFKGFNLIQHGCVQCIPVYLNLINAFESYYPEILHRFIAVNAPPSLDVLLRILRPVMSRATQDALEIYNSNRREWLPVVQNLISADQIDEQFGGNRIDL